MITGVILTHNEELNIVKCIQLLRPHVSELLLIDTESNDRTVILAEPLVDKIIHHPSVDNFDVVRNIAISEAKNDWLWFVDADEFVPPATGKIVIDWIRDYGNEIEAINIPFKTYFCGKWMEHCGWWPGYTCPRVLKRGHFTFSERLHQGVLLDGREVRVPAIEEIAVEHQSFRSIEHWITKCNRYTSIEANYLATQGSIFDWREAVRQMTAELWSYYELNQGQKDGERGWILSLYAAIYRWMAHSKLIDLGRSHEVLTGTCSIPRDIDEFLAEVEDALASCRRERLHLPIGVVFRAQDWSNSDHLTELMDFLEKPGDNYLSMSLEGMIDECAIAEFSPLNRRLIRLLQNSRRPPCSIAVSFCHEVVVEPDSRAFLNVLRTGAPFQTQNHIDGYDEIWVSSPREVQELAVLGAAIERIQLVVPHQNANSNLLPVDSLVVEIEKAATYTPSFSTNGINVEIEGEFFSGSSFANINEQISRRFIRDTRLNLNLKNVISSPVSLLRNRVGRELFPYLHRQIGEDNKIVIRHAFPPNWNRPQNAVWIHIQPWEYGMLPIEWRDPLQNSVDEIWVMSRYVENVYISSGIDKYKIHYIPWGVDTEVFRPDGAKRQLRTNKSFRFLFVGGTISRKGFDRLLEAYIREFNSKDDVCLVIKDVGVSTFYSAETMKGQIADVCKKPELPEIEYYSEDFLPSQLASLYRACNCFVAPYRGEGFGLPVLEAMACGIPAIVPMGGPTDDFVDNSNGFKLNSQATIAEDMNELCGRATSLEIDLRDLQFSMRSAFDDAARTIDKGKLASQQVLKSFTWERTVHEMTERVLALGQSSVKMNRTKSPSDQETMHLRLPAASHEPSISPNQKGYKEESIHIPKQTTAAKVSNSHSSYGTLNKSVLIQMAVGPHLELLDLTRNHHREYAIKHGMDYWDITGGPHGDRRPGWGKVKLIQAAIAMGYQKAIWLDADAVVVQPEFDVSSLISAGIGLVKHPLPEHWNTGLIIVHCDEQTDRFWSAVGSSPDDGGAWMEQSAVNILAGSPSFRALFRQIDLKFNSVPGFAASRKPVIVAGHGLPFEARKELIRNALSAEHQLDPKEVLLRRDDLAMLLNEMSLVHEAVEVGVYRGDFSDSLLSKWRGKRLHLVDAWKHLPNYCDIANLSDDEHEVNYQETLTRMGKYGDRCRILRCTSADAAEKFGDGSLDFVYLDANHAFEGIWQDLNCWYPKVRIGGILAGHDYLDGELPEGNFGVASALRVFREVWEFELELTGEERWRTWYFVRTH